MGAAGFGVQATLYGFACATQTPTSQGEVFNTTKQMPVDYSPHARVANNKALLLEPPEVSRCLASGSKVASCYSSLGFRVTAVGSGFRVQGAGFRVQG